MSDFDSQFNDVALPLLDERLGDALFLRVGGSAADRVAFRGIVSRLSEANQNRTTATAQGRDANENVQVQVTTQGIFPRSDDQIELPDGSVAHVGRTIAADPDGSFPLVTATIPRGITSKQSRTRG